MRWGKSEESESRVTDARELKQGRNRSLDNGMRYTDPRTMCKRGLNAVGTTRGEDDVEEPKGKAIRALQ